MTLGLRYNYYMLQEELKNVKQQVDEFLREFFDEKKKGIGSIHQEVKKLIADIEDVTLRGGDRFRPFMVYLGAKANQNINFKMKSLDSRLRGNDRKGGG